MIICFKYCQRWNNLGVKFHDFGSEFPFYLLDIENTRKTFMFVYFPRKKEVRFAFKIKHVRSELEQKQGDSIGALVGVLGVRVVATIWGNRAAHA